MIFITKTYAYLSRPYLLIRSYRAHPVHHPIQWHRVAACVRHMKKDYKDNLSGSRYSTLTPGIIFIEDSSYDCERKLESVVTTLG